MQHMSKKRNTKIITEIFNFTEYKKGIIPIEITQIPFSGTQKIKDNYKAE